MSATSDIFLSYSRDDQAIARHFAEGFERAGFSVWWDVTLKSGEDFDQVTEQALESAKAVVVLWSKKSVTSRWVRAEATQADRNKTLVPVTIEPCKRPIMFELKQTADLSHWQGDERDATWQAFLNDVRQFVQRDRPAGAEHSAPVHTASRKPQAARIGLKTWQTMAIGLVVGAIVAASTLLLLQPTSVSSSAPAKVARFNLPITSEDTQRWLGDFNAGTWGRPGVNSLAISPDGELIAYAGFKFTEDGVNNSLLYLHHLDEGEALPVADSAQASAPFFSPDGNWLGYATTEGLMRAPVSGGVAELLTPMPMALGRLTSAHWADNEFVLFTMEGAIFRVPAAGGTAEQLVGTEVDGQRYRYGGMHALPNGNSLLFHRMPSVEPARAEIVALDLPTGASKVLLKDAADPRYVGDGRLLFLRQGNLMAVKFDAASNAITGEPILLQSDVMQAWAAPNTTLTTGNGQYAVSAAGHLVYASGGFFPHDEIQLQLVGPEGHETLSLPQSAPSGLRVSPDGDQLLFSRLEKNGGYRIHLHDLVRDVTTLLIGDSFSNSNPVWSPDGNSLLYSSDRDGISNIYSQALEGNIAARRLAPSIRPQSPGDWSSQGTIVWIEDGDIWTLTLAGEAERWLATPGINERQARFSPDGDWLAYSANGSGRSEVYVRPFPGPGQAIQISGAGGEAPIWSPDGRALYYRESRSPPAQPVMMQVPITSGASFAAGRAEPLSWHEPIRYITSTPMDTLDIVADGRFLAALEVSVEQVLATGENATLPLRARTLLQRRVPANELHVVLNFAEELKARLP